MATTSTISVRVDANLKESAKELFEYLGMDLSTAINVFLRKSVEYDGIPFEIGHSYTPNDELKAAIEESRHIATNPHVKGYKNMQDLLAALNSSDGDDENDL